MNIIKSSLSGLAFALLGELVGINLVSAQQTIIHDTSIVPVTQSLVDAAGANAGANANFNSETGTFSVDGLGEGSDITFSPDVIQSLENLQGIAGSSANGSSANGDSANGDSAGGDSANGGLPNSVTVNDLAQLIQTDLQESVNSLVAAESVENQPRRFVRRRSSGQDCNCAVGSNGERKSVAQLQEELKQKTLQAENFVREVNKLDPENNIW